MFSKVKSLDIPEIKAKIVDNIISTGIDQYLIEVSGSVKSADIMPIRSASFMSGMPDGKLTNKYVFPLYFWVDIK